MVAQDKRGLKYQEILIQSQGIPRRNYTIDMQKAN